MPRHRTPGKPPYAPMTLDRAHPLARGLVDYLLLNERGGNPFNLGRPDRAASKSSGALWVPNQGGTGIGVASGEAVTVNYAGAGLAVGDYAIRIIHYPRSWGGTYVPIIDKSDGGGSPARPAADCAASSRSMRRCVRRAWSPAPCNFIPPTS